MKKYSGVLILLAILLGIASLIFADTFYPTNSVTDYENSEYEIETLLDFTVDTDSLFIVYMVESLNESEIFVRKYVYKIENNEHVFDYVERGTYIHRHIVSASYRFGE